MRTEKMVAVLLAMVFLTGCSAVKFGAGMVAESLVHQGGHYLGAKATGVNIKFVDGFDSIPGLQPNERITSNKPEPLAYGGSLILVAGVSELIMWQSDVLKDEDGKNFMTDFYLGFLTMASFDELNYGIRRSGLLGDTPIISVGSDGQNDLNKDKFGEYHKVAGLVSAAHGTRIAHKVITSKRVKKWWTKVKVWVYGPAIGVAYVF